MSSVLDHYIYILEGSKSALVNSQGKDLLIKYFLADGAFVSWFLLVKALTIDGGMEHPDCCCMFELPN